MPDVGFEPTAFDLQGRCTSVVLIWRNFFIGRCAPPCQQKRRFCSRPRRRRIKEFVHGAAKQKCLVCLYDKRLIITLQTALLSLNSLPLAVC